MIIVTNSLLCKQDFWQRMNDLVALKPNAVILREKHLDNVEYAKMAERCKGLCDQKGVKFFVNNNIEVAVNIASQNIHLSFESFVKNAKFVTDNFCKISVAVHSVEQAIDAQKNGATSLVAGHIFDTACKKDLPPRGLDFARKILDNVTVPVNAIGGIDIDNVQSVLRIGVDDFCIMSSAMTAPIAELNLLANIKV